MTNEELKEYLDAQFLALRIQMKLFEERQERLEKAYGALRRQLTKNGSRGNDTEDSTRP